MLKVGNKEVNVVIPSAYTLFEYIELFDSEYLEDLERCRALFLGIVNKPKGKDANPKELNQVMMLALRLVYVMQEERTESFKAFTKSIDGLMNNGLGWINEVIQNGYLVFQRDLSESRQGQGDK